MSSVDHLISTWREDLEKEPVYRAEDIEELEGHLREELSRLRGTPLTAEEAFLIARGRVGEGRELAGEYAKVNHAELWSRRLLWAFGGYIAILATFTFALLLSLGINRGAAALLETLGVSLPRHAWIIGADVTIQVGLALSLAWVLLGDRLLRLRESVLQRAGNGMLAICLVILTAYVFVVVGEIVALQIIEDIPYPWKQSTIQYTAAYLRIGWLLVFPLCMMGRLVVGRLIALRRAIG